MSEFLDNLIERAKSNKKTIVMGEGDDIRTLEAAKFIHDFLTLFG